MSVDVGLLILRVVVGLLLLGHGAQKLFGWFGGFGLQGTAGWFASMGLRPAPFWTFMAGIAEFGGGMLLALGISAESSLALPAARTRAPGAG